VEILGRQSLPKISTFLVVVAGFARNHHSKGAILGGAPRGYPALQTSHQSDEAQLPTHLATA
jgi:hypothetical protein